MKALIWTLRHLSYTLIFLALVVFIGTAGASDCEILTDAEFNRNLLVALGFLVTGILI